MDRFILICLVILGLTKKGGLILIWLPKDTKQDYLKVTNVIIEKSDSTHIFPVVINDSAHAQVAFRKTRETTDIILVRIYFELASLWERYTFQEQVDKDVSVIYLNAQTSPSMQSLDKDQMRTRLALQLQSFAPSCPEMLDDDDLSEDQVMAGNIAPLPEPNSGTIEEEKTSPPQEPCLSTLVECKDYEESKLGNKSEDSDNTLVGLTTNLEALSLTTDREPLTSPQETFDQDSWHTAFCNITDAEMDNPSPVEDLNAHMVNL